MGTQERVLLHILRWQWKDHDSRVCQKLPMSHCKQEKKRNHRKNEICLGSLEEAKNIETKLCCVIGHNYLYPSNKVRFEVCVLQGCTCLNSSEYFIKDYHFTSCETVIINT